MTGTSTHLDRLSPLFVVTAILGVGCGVPATEESLPAAVSDGGIETAGQGVETDADDAVRGDTQNAALRLSFVRQMEATPLVMNLMWDDPEVTFSGPDGSGGTTSWRVTIDATSIETQPDGSPHRGNIFSSWYRDGELVDYSTSGPTLPEAFGDMGILQQCYALWDSIDEAWGWI